MMSSNWNCVNNGTKLKPPLPEMKIVMPDHPQWNRLKFPLRLFHMLDFMESVGITYMAQWDDQGVCFMIQKSEELVDEILPFFFQQRKWKSFQRQMNIYSFKRILSGPRKGYYFHPFFQRSDISMAHKILRKKQKSELSPSALLLLAPKHSSDDEVFNSSLISSEDVHFSTTSFKKKNDDEIYSRSSFQFSSSTRSITTGPMGALLSPGPCFEDADTLLNCNFFLGDNNSDFEGGNQAQQMLSCDYHHCGATEDHEGRRLVDFELDNHVVLPPGYLTMTENCDWGIILSQVQAELDGFEKEEDDDGTISTIDDLSDLCCFVETDDEQGAVIAGQQSKTK